MNLKSFDWRMLQKYFNPGSAHDLNLFLERLPQNAGQTVLIAAGIAWLAAGMLGLYTTIQVKSMIELRADLKETQALKPPVPVLRDVSVPQKDVKDFTDILTNTYPNLDIRQQGSSIQITSSSTVLFGVFREAIGHVQNGRTGWRVSVERLCVGRECQGNNLRALLKINKVSVDKPAD